MQLFFAPMEGITSYLYRRVHASMFSCVDRYYAPFLAPDGEGNCRWKELRDLLPENNPQGLPVPQILCSRPEAFLKLSKELAAMGYEEVNLNAGCPSGTVVPKHKGAGMLGDLEALDAFLAEVFAHCPLRVSVKTRMGLTSTEEFPAILRIYEKYPLSQLIVHARSRTGMYKSPAEPEAFAAAFQKSELPLCYNGGILEAADRDRLCRLIPELKQLMLGRGAAANPALFRILQGGEALEAAELRDFMDRLQGEFLAAGLPERFALARLKELWYYWIWMFPGSGREAKAIGKAQTAADYEAAITRLFERGSFSPEGKFEG